MGAVKNEKTFSKEKVELDKAEYFMSQTQFQGNPLLPHYADLVNSYRRLIRQSVKLVNIGDTEADYLYKLQSDLKNILDNMGQGIFTTDENLMISGSYSAECSIIFEQDIYNKRFTDIIRQYNSIDKVQAIEQILVGGIFSETEFKRRVLIELLPEEITYKKKLLGIKYKIIKNEWDNDPKDLFMFIISDITEKKQLEDQIEEEKSLLKMIVKIVSEKKAFFRCINEYDSFIKEELDMILSQGFLSCNYLISIMRRIHTFKGNFSMFDMRDAVNGLHEIEQALSVLIDNYNRIPPVKIKEMVKGYDLKGIINKSLEKVRQKIGSQFFNSDEISISRNKLLLIEKKIKEIGDESSGILLNEISALKSVKFKTLLEPYAEYVQRLAERQGKLIEKLEIECPDYLLVDEAEYYNFTKTLVNVFRNAVCHGIEEPQKRLSSGKSEFGRIECSVRKINGRMEIKISDDGCGIDIDKLRQAAIKKGKLKQDELGKSELIKLIFSDAITTSDEITEFSGRGEGLSAVAEAAEQLGYSVEVDTWMDKGTAFTFFLPLGIIESQ
jgi:two-component system, chemotaxis family, sensor kinase CheA